MIYVLVEVRPDNSPHPIDYRHQFEITEESDGSFYVSHLSARPGPGEDVFEPMKSTGACSTSFTINGFDKSKGVSGLVQEAMRKAQLPEFR